MRTTPGVVKWRGGGSAIYLEGFNNIKPTWWWGKPVEIYLPAKGDILHNVTITFSSPESFDLEWLGDQHFIESEPLHFEELEVKRANNDSYVSSLQIWNCPTQR
jgi:hypothetical protein